MSKRGKAPTSTGQWPLRPSARATEAHAARWPNQFAVGDPIGYVRDPDMWLPEWRLDVMPLVNPKEMCYDRQVSEDNPQGDMLMSNENEDTRTPEQKAPKKASSKAKAPKAPKAPKEPKLPWAPSERAEEATAIMREFAEQGDKKTLAYFVAQAIDARARGKDVRESMTETPEEGDADSVG